jgi:hypothetical protein
LHRRRFLKYIGPIAVAVGGAAAAYSLKDVDFGRKTEATNLTAIQIAVTGQSLTLELVARFSYRTVIRPLQCIVPHSGEEVQFINETDVSPISTPVSYAWFVDDEAVSISKDYSCTLPETRTRGTPHLVKLIVSTPEVTSSTQQVIDVDPQNIPEYPERRMGIPIKGINYSVNGPNEGSPPPESEMKESLTVIRNEQVQRRKNLWRIQGPTCCLFETRGSDRARDNRNQPQL